MAAVKPHNLDIRESKVDALLMGPNWTLITVPANPTTQQKFTYVNTPLLLMGGHFLKC